MKTANTSEGRCSPLGPTVCKDGVNFSVYSKNAELVELLLFNNIADSVPSRVIALDPKRHRTYHYWHVFIPGVTAGQIYGFCAKGPFEPRKGLRFDPKKVLLDPYGKAVAKPKTYTRRSATSIGGNASTALKSVVVDLNQYDWEGDVPLRTPFSRTVIYEMHVRGFTRHPNSGIASEKRGTYEGLIEKIPYLTDLGITAVELLPIFEFDETSAAPGLTNYWGYSPISFFAPHQAYSLRRDLLGPLDEFRDMVKALHRAGIEIILDVVYNHTAEGNHEGPTFCYRGLANEAYYMLAKDKTVYLNYTGCGNTLNAGHAVVRRMILDSLRYWVSEMHVDGFRFDLASILTRDRDGTPLANPPILWDIESDPVLAGTKLIAEAWDAAGLYHVGSFVGDSWKEWNGKFRDDVRSFFKGEDGTVSGLAARILGSPDLYAQNEREPEKSINFITSHDGLTLNDLVSYNQKHNDANEEMNRDGTDDNRSWNCGIEGPTDDPEIERLRSRQVKNFLTILLLSAGAPMLLMGDEVRRTQRGNNNAYCQDNEISWFDWNLLYRHPDLLSFCRKLISFRVRLAAWEDERGLTLNELLRRAQIRWHGVALGLPDWGNDSHSLACTLRSLKGKFLVHAMINAYWVPLHFEVPPITESGDLVWHRWIDTALDAPDDLCEWSTAPILEDSTYMIQPRSVVVLAAIT